MIPSRSLHRLAPFVVHPSAGRVKPGYHLSHCPNFRSPLYIRFEKQSGTNDPIKFDEPIAINVRGGKWLFYKKRDTGINLSWSDTPKFEWLFKGGAAGTAVLSGNQLGLYNTVENDYLMYEPRDWGINLKWFKDSGKFNTLTELGEIATKAGEIIKIAGPIVAAL